MRHMFVTTALVAALSVTWANAQDTDANLSTTSAAPSSITPPDGFVESDAVLTSARLDGATVYDAAGNEIGEVYGLVFANGTTSMDDSSAATSSAPIPSSSEAGTDPGTSTAQSATVDQTTNAPADANTESTNVDAGTTTADSERVDNVGSDGTTITPTDATTPPAMTEDDAMATDMETAQITHAVIDVGGFLGISEHRVAIPIDDLVVYRKDTDIRIYLPWTKVQLEGLPEYDETGPEPVTQ